MSYENEQELQDGTGADGAEDGAGADDLNGGLGGDMAFSGEAKKPIDKGTIVVVALLVACAGLLYVMYARSGPDAAVAAAPGKDEEVIKTFLENKDKKVKEMDQLIKSTEKVVQQFRTEPPQVKTLTNNPFEREKPKLSGDREAADKERRLQLLADKVKDAVDDLRLQTIIARDPKKAQCMINNTLYRKGNKITVGRADEKVTFTVEEIRPDGVTVSAPGVEEPLKFELRMKH
jgi:hypothetical protein